MDITFSVDFIELNKDFIPSMSKEEIEAVYLLQKELLKYPQTTYKFKHVIHAGVYSRTVYLPANNLIVGALIKIPTQLIVCGDCLIFTGKFVSRVTGFRVFKCDSNRKQVIKTNQETVLTMIFKTNHLTVQDCEKEFTDEWENLL